MSERNEVAERNEAAERLDDLINRWASVTVRKTLVATAHHALVAERALGRAEGSRATVERYGSVLRRMYEHAKWYFPHNDETEDVLGEALAILDEVANAQEELRTADAKAAR